jgi:hypothetical protein
MLWLLRCSRRVPPLGSWSMAPDGPSPARVGDLLFVATDLRVVSSYAMLVA